jgi:hypothetical protein
VVDGSQRWTVHRPLAVMAPPDRPSQVGPDAGEVVGVPSALASSQTVAVRLVMGLLRAGVPLSLLADLSWASAPDSAGIYRAEFTGGAGSPHDLDAGTGGAHGWVGLLGGDGGVAFEGSAGRPPS